MPIDQVSNKGLQNAMNLYPSEKDDIFYFHRMSLFKSLLVFSAVALAGGSSVALALNSNDPWGWTGTAYHNGGSIIENGARDEFISYTGTLMLTGSVTEGVDRITGAWDGDTATGESALSGFRIGDASYRYDISLALKNIREGKNTYTIRQYAKDKLKRLWIADVEFYDATKKGAFTVPLVDAVPAEGYDGFLSASEMAQTRSVPFYFDTRSGSGADAPEYSNPDLVHEYRLALGSSFGDYALDLGNGFSMVYTLSYSEDETGTPSQKAKFKIVRVAADGIKTMTNEIGDIDFSVYQFNNPTIRTYAGNYAIVSTGAGYEGVAKEFLFDPVRMKLSDIYADLEKSTLGYRAYPIFGSSIRDGKLSLEETRYCCDRVYNPAGNERIVYDLDSMKLVSRKRLDPIDILAITDRKGKKFSLVSDFENGPIVSLSPEDYGFSLSRGQETYKVLNIGFVTEFYKDYGL
jgi:hypothetical protein